MHFLQNFKERVQQAEQQSGTLEEISTKGTVTIQTLQRENREAQERIIDLESRLRYQKQIYKRIRILGLNPAHTRKCKPEFD